MFLKFRDRGLKLSFTPTGYEVLVTQDFTKPQFRNLQKEGKSFSSVTMKFK